MSLACMVEKGGICLAPPQSSPTLLFYPLYDLFPYDLWIIRPGEGHSFMSYPRTRLSVLGDFHVERWDTEAFYPRKQLYSAGTDSMDSYPSGILLYKSCVFVLLIWTRSNIL